MSTRRIAIAGARGGHGASTVSALLAIHAAEDHSTALLSHDPDALATVVGVPPLASARSTQLADRLTLAWTDAVREATEVVVADLGTVASPMPLADERYVVLRGPCYLGLKTVLESPWTDADGLIALIEDDRSLRSHDAVDVLGMPLVARIDITPAVARTIDAGLLLARARRIAALAPLRRIAAAAPRRPDHRRPLTRPPRRSPIHPVASPAPLIPSPTTVPALNATASTSAPRSDTDMPCPQADTTANVQTSLSRRCVATRIAIQERQPPARRPRKAVRMLNIGKLSPGAAEYYVGEVASSAEEYYVGHGEAPGRWVGSLAPRLGLVGKVKPEDFRNLLEGRHPLTGEWLLSARGSAQRAAQRRRCRSEPGQRGLFDSDGLDVARVAARLKLSTRHVRRLLATGEQQWARLNGSTGSAAIRDGNVLVGQRVHVEGQSGPAQWRVVESEVERFEAQRRHNKARPGYDLTLRPPKSVSILWALGSKEQQAIIRSAHCEAVDAVVTYYESQAIFARRGGRGRARLMTDGLVAAAFDHRTSRAGDPLLHTHVVTANLTQTVEGRWQAIDGRSLYAHGRSGGYLYQAQLRHALSRDAGVEWDQVNKGCAEVRGVPRELIRTFSKRRDEIENVVAEAGYTSARAHGIAAVNTRKPKGDSVDTTTLIGLWRAEAKLNGFGAEQVDACFGHEAPVPGSPEVIDRLLDRLAGPLGLTEQASTFSRRDVVEALSATMGPAAHATQIVRLADQFLASDRVVSLERPAGSRASDGVIDRDLNPVRTSGTVRYSTPELLAVEAQVLQWADTGFGTNVPKASGHDIADVIADHPELSDEQIGMVRAVCLSDTPIQSVAGRPGAGKTYATDACIRAFLSSGAPVVGCAVSATAATELEAMTGLEQATGRPASTIARLLMELDEPVMGGFAPGTVLIIDEASMVGTRDLARLGRHLARAGGAMKLVGDPDQHAPVDAGGVFRKLCADDGDDLVRLVENNRQTDEIERLAIDEYRQGRIGQALARYDAAGKIVRSPNAAQSYDAIVTDWYARRLAGSDDPMIAGPNSIRRALNARARWLLKAEEALSGPALVAHGREFMVGDSVVTRKNDRRLCGTRRGSFVKNGSVGTVVEVDPKARELLIEFKVEGRVHLPRRYIDAGWVEHGYARTSYGVQGATLERGYYTANDESTFEEGYVALTRGRHATNIYVVDGEAIRDNDLSYEAHDVERTGLSTVGAALEQRSTNPLAHELDPTAADRYTTFGDADKESLRAERDRLEAVITGMPLSVKHSLEAAMRYRDMLVARRRLHGGTRAVDRRIAAMDRQLGELQNSHAARSDYINAHADDLDRLVLVGKAERALHLRATTEPQSPAPMPEP